MKIAILSSIAWRTPPRKYGPWEQVASYLAEGLVARGIDVTLFATADSITAGTLDASCNTAYAEDPEVDPKVAECLHISNVMEKAAQFDLIHNHFDFLPLTYSKLIKTPVLTTIHGFSSEKIKQVYQKYNAHTHYVSISNADRDANLDYAATVYNGIDSGAFNFVNIPDDYLLFFGRIHPHKGAREAIQIAKESGRRLMIAGLIQDEGYYEREVKPHIDFKTVFYCGNVGPEKRSALLGMAYAMLHPISFDEPFGLSVAESMLCGTPVIAFNRGSMPELIQDGKTGFLVHSVEEAVKAVGRVNSIHRKDCAEWAQSMFSKEKMVDGYLRVYETILGLGANSMG
ncbi:glycosyltransferase family 4 protein [Dyadobacter sp. CY107]|uniref:glycosyltransferase family 4 protein n=1 Tax=Dyadobacter fanqingshengii TaxID=2906443 RepID=UPI001F34E9C3|nr:glycosyltransferase family 4 protein [Dyadobacter fanqingshengii]MCF2502420.1 glycosyltransferase family 4 protein [Dyadobacter fanqingshengii]